MANHNHFVDIVTHDIGDYSVTCVECETVFEAMRSDAAFCSAKCRVAYSRRPARIASAIARLQATGEDAKLTAEKYRFNRDVFEAMLRLKKDIDIALGTFEGKG